MLFCLFLLFNALLGSFLSKEHALDLMFAYSAEDAYAALGQLSTEQLSAYEFGIWALDMPYMGVYCLLFSGLLLRVWKHKNLVLLPIAIALMDLVENLSVLKLLALYPTRDPGLAMVASVFTTSKWLLVGIMIPVLIVGLVYLAIPKRRVASKSAQVRA